MLQAVDNRSSPPGSPDSAQRAQWMALLARVPVDLLASALAADEGREMRMLRAPETGLVMVQGRAGGTGQKFNVGEVTVTRCTLRLNPEAGGTPLVGVAYVMGRSHRQARLAALADALLQDPVRHADLQRTLLLPGEQWLAERRAIRHAAAQSSRVEFFTVAREAGAMSDEEDAQ